MKLFHCKDILAHLATIWQGCSPYDRLLAAVTDHRLDDALSILEGIGCDDPSAQIRILAACQKGGTSNG